jgi:hypothetical protein
MIVKIPILETYYKRIKFLYKIINYSNEIDFDLIYGEINFFDSFY